MSLSLVIFIFFLPGSIGCGWKFVRSFKNQQKQTFIIHITFFIVRFV